VSDLSIRQVETKADLKAFIRMTHDHYKTDTNWVQPLTFLKLEDLDPKKNPFFDNAEVQLWLAEKDSEIVGRVSAQIDKLAQEKWGPNLGYFGLFEADSERTAHVLLKIAEDWLKERGMQTMQGPWSLSPKEECGMLVEGFSTPPCFLMPHGKPDYKGWVENYGLKKAHDLIAYELDLLKGFPEKMKRIVAAAKRNKRVILREMDMKNYDRDIGYIIDIVSDAWANNWGFTPFTQAEGKHLATSLKLILKPHRTVICEYDSEPVAFMVTIPDLNDDIKDFGGSLFPFNVFKLLSRRILSKKEGRMRVPLMGVKQAFQRRPVGAAMAMWMIDYSTDQVMERGAYWGELGWILDENEGMRSILKDIGCEEYKTYGIFEKTIL
jgi:hypothetical protein